MKKKATQQFTGKLIAGFLAVVLMISGVCLLQVDGNMVQAEGSTAEPSESTETFITEYVEDISEYRGTVYTYPKPTTEGKESWIFAGWYADAAGTIAYTTDKDLDTDTRKTMTDDVTSAYAKYVPAGVLSVKTQVASGTEADSESTSMRFVSTVDSTNYRTVGFRIISNGKTKITDSKEVYKRIKSNTDGLEVGYSPVALDVNSGYFQTFTLTNIKNANFDRQHFVQAYWKTLDGTIVYGTGRNVKVSDSYNKIANVPVRLYTDSDVTGGTVQVAYDSSLFTYIEDAGYESGMLITEDKLEVLEGTTVEKKEDESGNSYIEVTLPEGTTLGKPNGTLVNLRFKMSDGAPSNNTFGVSGDVSGVFDVVYKTYSQYYDAELGADTSWYDTYKTEQVFVISTANDLYGLAEIVNSNMDVFNGDTIYLGADVAVNDGVAANWSSAAPEHEWTPIGTTYMFKGTFHGLGHTIRGLYLKDDESTGEEYQGLFGWTSSSSVLRNFSLKNSYFESVTEKGCLDSNNNTYRALLGSVAGAMKGRMDTVYSDAIVVSGNADVGGLIGRVNGTLTINNCWFAGSVTMNQTTTVNHESVGGIVGRLYSGTLTITNCLNSGNVTYKYETKSGANVGIGGILGCVVKNDYKTGSGVGTVSISNSMNTGYVTGENTGTGDSVTHIASILGYNQGGTVTFNNIFITTESNSTKETGYGGNNNGTITNNGITRQNEANFNGHIAYINTSSLGYYDADTDAGYWVIREEADTIFNGSPVLKSFCDAWIDVAWYYDTTGYNEGGHSFTIMTAEELYGFSAISQEYNFNEDTVELGKDIEMNSGVASVWATSKTVSARTFTPIGKGADGTDANGAFQGTFDGKGYKVSGIYIEETSGNSNGFFGQLKNSTVQNFKLSNSYIWNNGAGNNTGSIVGILRTGGTISGVYSDAIVKTTGAKMATGGIVGILDPGNCVSNCWFEGTVESNGKYTGGIVGRMNSGTPTIENCISSGAKVTSTVSDDACVGGVVGGIRGSSSVTIQNCISTTAVESSDGASNYGSVVGYIADPTTFVNVYTTTSTGGDIVGLGNNSTSDGETTTGFKEDGAIIGKPALMTTNKLTGENAYIYTELDFTSENCVWGIVEGDHPVLKAFYDGDIKTDLSGQKMSSDWYYNYTYYDSNMTETPYDKSANDTTTAFAIQNEDDFYGFADMVNTDGMTFTGKTIALATDLVFNGVTTGEEAAKWAEAAEKGETVDAALWTPIGTGENNPEKTFSGTFDGDNHTISGIYMNQTEQVGVGLFGNVTGATIQNLRITNSYFKGGKANGEYAALGSVIGYCNGVALNNVYSDAIVKSTSSQSGGIVGRVQASSTLKNCWFDGTLDIDFKGSAENYLRAGGVIGNIGNGTMTSLDTCLYTGDILFTAIYTGTKSATFNSRVGGLVGSDAASAYASVKNCFAGGTISATLADSEEQYCTAMNHIGSIMGRTSASGAFADTYATTTMNITIEKTDETTSSTTLIGTGASSASVTTTKSFASDYMLGYGSRLLTNLTFTSDEATTAVVNGYWMARLGEVPIPSTMADVVSNELAIGDIGRADTSWHADENKDSEGAYVIDSIEELYGFAVLSQSNNFSGETIKLGADINLNDSDRINLLVNAALGTEANWDAAEWAEKNISAALPWYKIGTTSNGKKFSGTFDGQNYSITGLYMNQSVSYMGLFSATEYGSKIQNLRLENSYFKQNGSSYLGSIVSECRGSLYNIYSNAILETSYDGTGGIAGRANGYDYTTYERTTDKSINNCWFDGQITVTGEKKSNGGIIGTIVQGQWKMENCVFTGSINTDITSGGAFTGGLVGEMNAPANQTTTVDEVTYNTTGETKLTMDSCISTGTIQTVNADVAAGAIVGGMWAKGSSADDARQSHLTMTNVFASRNAGYKEVGYKYTVKDVNENVLAAAEATGETVWTNKEDRLIGYCVEETKDGYYDGGNLDFANSAWILREEGVPVPATFADMTNVVTKVNTTDLNTILALTTMDAGWSLEQAQNYGLGHYVLTTTDKDYDAYTKYLEALEAQGFAAYVDLSDGSTSAVAYVSEESAADGVYNVIYTREAGDWVLNVLFVANTKKVTLTISHGIADLSEDLKPQESTPGTASLSMLSLTGSEESDAAGINTYNFGNSFVFQLANGNFIICDGGNDGDFDGLMTYLESMNGDKDTIVVEAWVVSHQHADHFDVVNGFYNSENEASLEIAEKVRVNAIYINEPNRVAMLVEEDVMKYVKLQYRGIRVLRDENGNTPNVYWYQTGQRYYFDGLTMDVVQSQEQIPMPYEENYAKRNASANDGTDYNTTSTNVMFTTTTTTNKKKVFITGDSNYKNAEYMMNTYGSETSMLSNINVFQAMHHGKNTSYVISGGTDADINKFTNYLTSNGNHKFDVVLFPYSCVHGIERIDVIAFPNAGTANKYLIENCISNTGNYYDFEGGTKRFILGETIDLQ